MSDEPSISQQAQGSYIAQAAHGGSATVNVVLPAVSLTEKQRNKNRTRMLDRVHTIWIKGVLEPSVQGAAQIALELENKSSAVVTPMWREVREFDTTGPLSSATSSIGQVYDDANGEVLILGEPGAGKTTLLLELTRALLERVRQDETHPIPVVFSLSSWATRRQPLTEWLASELHIRYQVPLPLATSWIETDQVLPLLDGLDEVAALHRAACVETINTYRQAHGLLPTVVCSRQTDYLVLSTRLLLRTAVVVQPLTPEQIETYLESAGEHAEALYTALRQDADLRELVTTPLMLTILLFAYRGTSADKVSELTSLGAKREQIFASYVQHVLKRHGTSKRYQPEQITHWLTSLAWQMKRQNQTLFYLERIQPDWLPTPWIRWVYHVSIGLLVGLFCLFIVLLAGLIFGTSSVGQSTGLLVGLIAGFLIALVCGFLSGRRREIRPAERVTWSWKKALRGYGGTGLVVGWLLSLNWLLLLAAAGSPPGPAPPTAPDPAYSSYSILAGISLLLNLPFPLFIGLINGLRIKVKPFRMTWSWKRAFRSELVIACLPALFAALLGGPLVGLFLGLSGDTLEKSAFTRPNEGIWRSARNSILSVAIAALTLAGSLFLVVLIVSLISAPEPKWQFLGELWISDLLHTLPFVLPIIMIIVLIIGLIAGGLACIQHITLRVFLQRKGSVPWNYPQFLDYAAERILLRKVGGGYIFLHRLVLDYFAARETEPVFHEPTERRQTSTPAPVFPSIVLSEPTVSAVLPDLSVPTISLAPPTATSEAPLSLSCGHELRAPGARFCSVCGASITMPQTPT